ncbi:MAG: asparaginase [Bacteroidales bacterium]|jgi:L-asparaginase|nr:asparaginase [Bacteroidales bacterium]
MIDNNASVLLIYTGGTIGMMENEETGCLESFDFEHLKNNLPEFGKLRFKIDSTQFDPPIDSSDMNLKCWQKIVRIIQENYNHYDGFVILHGTDTMAYTASALSFMLENIDKPVILTGSQLPIGKVRTDGKENLITALEIAVDKDHNGHPFVPEVCIFFQNDLMRGNRTKKINAENFSAFKSFNYPVLAKAGVHIKYEHHLIIHPRIRRLPKFHYLLDPNVVILKIFPNMSPDMVDAILHIPDLKGVVLETYGTGNAPNQKWFLDSIKNAIDRGVVVVNITQCISGTVEMGRYQSGSILWNIGVVSGYNSTTEAAVTKLMFLLGHGMSAEEVKNHMRCSLVGEIDTH